MKRKRFWFGLLLFVVTGLLWLGSIRAVTHVRDRTMEIVDHETYVEEPEKSSSAPADPLISNGPIRIPSPNPDPGMPDLTDPNVVRLLQETDQEDLLEILARLRAGESPEDIRPASKKVPDGRARVVSMEQFTELARRDNVPGALGVREVKFLCVDVESNEPKVYLINTKRYPYHHCYVRDVLRHTSSLSKFKSLTYNRQHGRRYLAGSLIAHENFQREDGGRGIFTMEFWPTDNVPFHYISTAHKLVSTALEFASEHVYYHPNGETQEETFESEKQLYNESDIPVIFSNALFGKFRFSPLNRGVAFGLLKVAKPSATYSARDIVVFRTLPNDLSLTAGIITEVPQTPLSHVNLKAQQNGIPNAYIKDAISNPEISPLIGSYVRYEVTNDGYTLERADPLEVEAFLESIRPKKAPELDRDLTIAEIVPLSRIGFHDAPAFGVKAANVAELGRFLPSQSVPHGFAIPFYYYDVFMKYNGFYDEARAMYEKEDFKKDPEIRKERLKLFRKKIRAGLLPDTLMTEFQELFDSFPSGTTPRCRSSTNNEDLENFNGAGLYNSCTHREDEGHLSKSIKQVWASLWTYRAFEERDFYRVDHQQVAMGVLVHPNYEEEQANGVGITRNIFDPRWPGFYVNVQVGEDLVTNPEEESIPEEFLISYMLTDNNGPTQYKFEIQYARKSNRVQDGERVIPRDAAIDLARVMHRIQQHFQDLYNREGDDGFAMDIEFKITREGVLLIKQARPWVWPALPDAENTDC